MRIAFAVSETGPDTAAGDRITAQELGDALALRFGWQVEYRPLEAGLAEARPRGTAGYELDGVDVLVAMVDEFDPRAIRSSRKDLIKIAWARNWFTRWGDHPAIGMFDLVLGSSERATHHLSERTSRPARLLRIATNADRFSVTDRPAAPELDFVFTGSYWQAERDVVAALSRLPRRYRGAVYGKNWEQVPEFGDLARGFVRYEDLPEVYRRAALVIDDANHTTKDWGAANSRVFDALAAGCLVITNSESVSKEVFRGRLPVYRSPDELSSLLDHYLSDDRARTDLQSRLRQEVLRKHCYSHRAIEFGVYLSGLGERGRSLCRLPKRPGLIQAPKLPGQPEGGRVQSGVGTCETPVLLGAYRWPTISLVIPVFNQLAVTQAMLASLLATLPPQFDGEIVLSDDASTDGTRTWLRSLRDPRIKLRLGEYRQGFAANVNAGARLAKGELLGLLNNDLVLTPGWLEPMVAILADPGLRTGAVGNVQVRVDDALVDCAHVDLALVDRAHVDHAGIFVNPIGQLAHIRTMPKSGTARSSVLAVTGACLFLRRADFEAHGGFDEQYVNGAEDVDLCFKLREAGQRIYVANDSVIGHHVSRSRGATSLNDERNSRRLYQRWRPVIKKAMSEAWLERLTGDQLVGNGLAGDWLASEGSSMPDELGGVIEPGVLATPHLAARRIAEVMLARQEARWAEILGPGRPDGEQQRTAKGFREPIEKEQ